MKPPTIYIVFHALKDKMTGMVGCNLRVVNLIHRVDLNFSKRPLFPRLMDHRPEPSLVNNLQMASCVGVHRAKPSLQTLNPWHQAILVQTLLLKVVRNNFLTAVRCHPATSALLCLLYSVLNLA